MSANGGPAPIGGFCDTRFSRVRDAFNENFTRHAERGGAVTISVGGRIVVDLWGGWSDVARTAPWQRDTIVNFFSVSKALCAIAIMRLEQRGALDLDARVAAYWPEFAANGKEGVTVRQLMSHRAGLPALRKPLAADAMLRWNDIANALAAETPWWHPGIAHGYHVNTFGFLAGELVRRIDGRSIGVFLREEIALPLDADVHIGLPAHEHHRAAEFMWPRTSIPPRPETEDELTLMRWNTYWNPAGFSGANFVNSAAWRTAEIPSTNGHGSARGIARIYAALACGGEVDGVQILSRTALAKATQEQSRGDDLVTQRQSRFGIGFQLTELERPLGPNPGAFGHFGAGGSLGFCDPESGVAFGYVTNDMGPRWQNPRNRGLIEAVFASL